MSDSHLPAPPFFEWTSLPPRVISKLPVVPLEGGGGGDARTKREGELESERTERQGGREGNNGAHTHNEIFRP